MVDSPCVNVGVGTFILHESGHGLFVYLYPVGVALHITIRHKLKYSAKYRLRN